jgi:hypothetical protein
MSTSEESRKAIKEVKPIKTIEKYTFEDLFKWMIEALDLYPESRKKALERLVGQPWSNIRSDIISTVNSRDYAEIHQLYKTLSLDLLNPNVVKKIRMIIDGTLGVIRGDSIEILAQLSTLNTVLKDPKVEIYLLYRLLGGKPRIRYNIFRKV